MRLNDWHFWKGITSTRIEHPRKQVRLELGSKEKL